MKFDLSNTRIFIRPGITDLRISTDELLNLIKNIMGQNKPIGIFRPCLRLWEFSYSCL